VKKSLLIKLIPVIVLIISAVTSIIFSPALYALNVSNLTIQDGVNAVHGNGQPSELFGAAGIFTTISSLLLYIIGALSVIMIIFGGLRYVISGGNTASVTAAKNTILYAIVGVIVALLAYSIVNFVLGSLLPGGSGGTNA
jgi:hypothetical protein